MDEAWDQQARTAAAWDDRHRVSPKVWVPPIMHDLVMAARTSPLGQFYPFTSHAWLRFRTVPNLPPWGGDVLSVMIGLTPDAHYLVTCLQAGKWAEPEKKILKTDSASAAVTRAAALIPE